MSRNVLVTGGSSGIGLALSHRLAARGDTLLWVSRTQSELDAGLAELRQRHPNAVVHTLALDLTTPGAADAVLAWTEAEGHTVHVMINNAGFASWGLHETIDEARDLAMFQLNMVVPTMLTRRFLPGMRQRGVGHLVYVASTAGMVPMSGFATYGATKAFLRHYAWSLKAELDLQNSPVKLTVVCPAAVRNTGFQTEAGMQSTDIFDGFEATTPDEVADDVMRGLDANVPEVVSGWTMRWLLPILRLLPRWVLNRAVAPNLGH